MRERILILGAGVMQGPAMRIAGEMGLYTVAADANSRAVCAPLADRFEQVDLKDKEGIERLGRSLLENGGLGGIMTVGTDFSAAVAWAAEKLGLPGIPYEAALNASDKGRMRSCFKKAGVPSPEFTVLTGLPDEGTLPGLSFPLVIKPVDNMGGRGCRRADTFAELRTAVEDSLRFSRTGRVIVESFMEGPEFSVDAIVYQGEITICGMADRHIYFPPFFIEMGHTMPTAIDTEKQRSLLEVFRTGIKALGIAEKNCFGAAKGDIKFSPSGPMAGEIAARLSGGYMSGWTYPYASGAEPIRGAILAALGRKPEGIEPLRSWTCAERAFISIPGKVKAIMDREKAEEILHVRDLFLRTGPGETVRFPENNVGKCGNVIACAPDRDGAVSAAEKAAAAVLIHLEPHNAFTGAFLDGVSPLPGFPPDAFVLDSFLREALDLMPDPEPAGKVRDLKVLDFPGLRTSGLRDYAGRTVEESLEAVSHITGHILAFVLQDRASGDEGREPPAAPRGDRVPRSPESGGSILGRRFWAALVRGGYQGAAYLLDGLET